MPLYMLTAEKENAAILTGDSNFKGKDRVIYIGK